MTEHKTIIPGIVAIDRETRRCLGPAPFVPHATTIALLRRAGGVAALDRVLAHARADLRAAERHAAKLPRGACESDARARVRVATDRVRITEAQREITIAAITRVEAAERAIAAWLCYRHPLHQLEL